MSVYEYRNPHPKGLNTTDCVVRAVALAFDADYIETRKILNQHKRFIGIDSYKNKNFLYDYLEPYERIIIPKIKGKPRLNPEEFIKTYGNGTFIVKMAKHVVCIKNGKLLDTWDSSEKTIYTAWRIE